MSNRLRQLALARASKAASRGSTGEGSQRLRVALRTGVVGNDGQPKLMSRLLGSWSDKVRVGDVPVGLHMPAMFLFSQLCKPAPIIKRVGPTRTFKALLWRDDKPSLFDLCQAQPTPPHTRKHQPSGVLPEFKVIERKPNALKLEADDAVKVWRAARQLEHLAALTEWRR